MAKSKKESITKVEAAALDSKTKPSKKSKRDAEVELDIPKNPKKQKKELIQAVEKAPPPPKKKKKKKAQVSPTKTSKQEIICEEKKMAESEQKSNAKQPETLTKETPTTKALGGSNYKLFAGNLSSQTKKSDLEKFFKEIGEIKDVRVARGYGHVEFASAEAVQKALKLNRKSLRGRKIKLDEFNTNPAPLSSNADGNIQRGEGSQVKTILVKKIGKFVGEDEMKTALRDHFSACGEITRFAIPCDKVTGATKGMAFLDLNEVGLSKALELNGSELGGRNIVVTEASTRGQNADRNSGRGSRAGRRRGRPLRQRRRGPKPGNDDSSKRGPERGPKPGNDDSSKRGPEGGDGDQEHPAKQV